MGAASRAALGDACGTLATLAAVPGPAERAVQEGGVEALCAFLADTPPSESADHLLRALAVLLLSAPSAVRRAANLGCGQLVSAQLAAHTHHLGVREHGALCLRSLASASGGGGEAKAAADAMERATAVALVALAEAEEGRRLRALLSLGSLALGESGAAVPLQGPQLAALQKQLAGLGEASPALRAATLRWARNVSFLSEPNKQLLLGAGALEACLGGARRVGAGAAKRRLIK